MAETVNTEAITNEAAKGEFVTVKAAVLREIGGVPVVEEIELAPPGPGQVRVRLAATGVCHSDLSLANGTLKQSAPVVLGHEGAGRVAEVGEGVWGMEVGDPVVLNWAPACRSCWYCDHGEPYLCERAGRRVATSPLAPERRHSRVSGPGRGRFRHRDDR
jgi:S-(hydroxymethyl)glutathione dehydrogenase/alcohol dehydrogenase